MKKTIRPAWYHPENPIPDCTMRELLEYSIQHIEQLPYDEILHINGHPLNELIRRKLGISLTANLNPKTIEYEDN